MATEKETVILDFKVDQGDAIQELERTKKLILDLKKEQDALNKAYKAGTITQEEYVSELVRVESILKKSQNTYSNVQKSVTGVKTSMDKLVESTKNAANQVNVAGVNVGALGARLTSLANPLTATVGIVGALGAAYARSTIGAKDLEFASRQLSAITTILTNNFAELISSSEDGEGLFTRLLNSALNALGPMGAALASTSKSISQAFEDIEDLRNQEIDIRADVSKRLGENQEKLEEINQEQTSYNRKLQLAEEIGQNLLLNEQQLLVITSEKLKIAEQQLKQKKGDTDSEVRAVNLLKKELIDIETNTNKREKVNEKLIETIKKQNTALREQKEILERKTQSKEDADARELRDREVSFSDDPNVKEFDVQEQFEKDQELINAELGLARTAEQEKQTLALQTNAVEQMIHDERVARFEAEAEMLRDGFNTIANLFSDGSEAKRVFALAGIGADTAAAIASLTAASEANPANAFTFGGAGIAQYAAGIIRILSNIVAAKSFLGGEFAGGGDFVTSKPTMIMVGDNPGNRERVTVEPLSGRGRTTYNPNSGFARFAGGGSMTFDGNKELAVASVKQNLQLVNSFKKMPKPVVGVDEITRVMNRVAVKERISR